MLAQIETDKVTIDVKHTAAQPGRVKELLVKEEVRAYCVSQQRGASDTSTTSATPFHSTIMAWHTAGQLQHALQFLSVPEWLVDAAIFACNRVQ